MHVFYLHKWNYYTHIQCMYEFYIDFYSELFLSSTYVAMKTSQQIILISVMSFCWILSIHFPGDKHPRCPHFSAPFVLKLASLWTSVLWIQTELQVMHIFYLTKQSSNISTKLRAYSWARQFQLVEIAMNKIKPQSSWSLHSEREDNK